MELMLPPSRSEPLRPQILASLAAFTTLTSHLFTHLSSPNPPPNLPPPSALITALQQLDEHLSQLLELQTEHAKNAARIEELVGTLERQETAWQEGVKRLGEAEKLLSGICKEGEEYRKNAAAVNAAALTPTQILSHASLVSPYTSAPSSGPVHHGAETTDPGIRALLPFPAEYTIFMGRMGREAAGMGMGGLGPEIGESIMVGQGPVQVQQQQQRPVPRERERPPVDEDIFDLDLNPDL